MGSATSSKPIFSVIIPTYRDWRRLRLCLDALGRQTLGTEAFEVIVANNDPADACPLGPLPANVRLVDAPDPGSYSARNVALMQARGEYLAFTDNDCVPAADWLERGLALLQANPGARVTGPVEIFREPQTANVAFLYDFHTAFRIREYAVRGQCTTANLLVSHERFMAVGPFSGGVFSGGDSEWNRRASAAGLPLVYDEGVKVGHPARQSLRAIFAKGRRIAGARARDPGTATLQYLRERAGPPRKVLKFDRGESTRLQRWLVFCIHWMVGWAAIGEFGLVRLGLKGPNRS